MKSYLEIIITTIEPELLIPTMVELGCHGFQETATELFCYIDTTDWSKQQMSKLQHDMKNILQTISSNAGIRMKTIEEENWNVQWEKTVVPIEIGDHIVVKPSWSTYEDREGRMIIQIDPKMSFGTGYHETTRLVIRLLERYVTAGSSMLDVGTGTGILAIVAAKLGCESVVAIDNDEWAITNAQENVQINNVSDRVTIGANPLSKLMDHFDLIAANITLNSIIELLPEMSKRLAKNGTLILSGLLQADEQSLRVALKEHAFFIIETLAEQEWIAAVARRQ